ncbi:MAG: cytochrome c oxidase assembly protein [Actinomycetota bacterium]
MPAWHLHPDVLLFVGLLAGGYIWAAKHIGPTKIHPIERAVSRKQVLLFSTGVVTVFVASYWPMHDLAEGHLYSVHMIQHMLLSLIAPPLLMIGTPDWLWRAMLGRRGVAILRVLSRPLIALVLFNLVIAVSHIPGVVTLASRSEIFHFSMHAWLFSSAIVMWTPVVNPLIELPKLNYPARMFYLFLQSLVPTVPASFLTFGHGILYKVYATPPETFGISPITDQRAAGLIMKLVGGFVLWAVIAWYFFKWFDVEDREKVDVLEWTKLANNIDGTELAKR